MIPPASDPHLPDALLDMVAALGTDDPLADQLKQVHDVLWRVMDASNLYIAVYDERSGLYFFPYNADPDDQDFAPQELRQSLTDHVRRTAAPLLCTQATHEQMQADGLVEVIGLPAPVWLGAPLMGRRGCFGAVVVQHYSDPNAMTEADLPKLMWAARCMGVAIERSFVAERREAEQRHRMQALALSRDEAVRANQAKSTFLATMSHELRTPLNAILGYADLLLETHGDDPELASDLGAIRGSALHLRDLIDDVLDLTQVESGAFEPSFAPVDLVELLAAVRTQSAPLAETNRNALVFVGERDAGMLRTDRRALFQALSNLVDNACKFTRDGRVAVRARRRQGEDLLVLEVSDTGVGIEPSLLPHLFEPFTQVDGSATRVHGGTGLGLAISRRLVEALGGTLTAASVPGRGSTFTVRLPAPNAG